MLRNRKQVQRPKNQKMVSVLCYLAVLFFPLVYPLHLPLSRRSILIEGAAAASSLLIPLPSFANVPISVSDLEDTKRTITSFELRREAVGRPKPTKLFRRQLDQQFAVLLMRTSYSVLDEMDVVAMDQFQRDFFLIRSTYYEDYVSSLGGSGVVKQGDLTDPSYFDYISFAQVRWGRNSIGVT